VRDRATRRPLWQRDGSGAAAAAEEVGMLEDDASRFPAATLQLVRVGSPAAMRNLDDLEAETRPPLSLTTCRNCGCRLRVTTTVVAASREIRDVAGVGGDG